MICEMCHEHVTEGTQDEYTCQAYGVCKGCLLGVDEKQL